MPDSYPLRWPDIHFYDLALGPLGEPTTWCWGPLWGGSCKLTTCVPCNSFQVSGPVLSRKIVSQFWLSPQQLYLIAVTPGTWKRRHSFSYSPGTEENKIEARTCKEEETGELQKSGHASQWRGRAAGVGLREALPFFFAFFCSTVIFQSQLHYSGNWGKYFQNKGNKKKNLLYPECWGKLSQSPTAPKGLLLRPVF